MRQYELLDAMTFKHGRFKLTPEQFANRRYVTRLVGEPSEMVVEPIIEISFKRGETITADIEIPRAVEFKLRPLAGQSQTENASQSVDAVPIAVPAGDAPTADPLADIPTAPNDADKSMRRRR